MAVFETERALVLDAARRIAAQGLIVGTAGNVSQRIVRGKDPDLVAITPTSRYYDSLISLDITVVDFGGNVVEGNIAPSSEVALHLSVYSARRDVGAIVHTHSTHASALAVARKGIPAILEEEVVILGGEISVADYAQSGSLELAESAVRALGDRKAVLLSNHGVVGVGATLQDAINAAVLVERTAAVYLLALAAGGAQVLSRDAVARARDKYLASLVRD